MAKLPVLKPREVVALLETLGFVEVRQRGSHKQFRHPDGRGTTVPFHKGRDISPALLRQIARDIGLTAEVLLGLEAPQAEQPDPRHPPPATESPTT
jgi:predicted RNA binding protein YcfA (HicA-like mRNA interferase family)